MNYTYDCCTKWNKRFGDKISFLPFMANKYHIIDISGIVRYPYDYNQY